MTSQLFTKAAGPQPAERCAWYLRVSTPKQKLEHQREHVVRFCENTGIAVPDNFRFEDKEKRHKSDKRRDFQLLLDAVTARKLDWILICSFDRWGVADVDEFFEFRRLLLKNDVQLWSVVDQMNLTGLTEGDYFRIVAMAIGATKYVEQMAEKNILKMIEMAKHGWAATGNAPYGTDLVCYPLHDLCRPLFRVVRTKYMRPHMFRVIHYSPESRVERDERGIIVAYKLTSVKTEDVERMPARDKKGTGYRFEPSVEEDRPEAVRKIYELYDAGLGFTEISRNLWAQGFKHYDKEFLYHGIETILANPVYLGTPAWGKIGVGTYRILHGGGPTRIRRKATDTLVVRKKEEQYAMPLRPVFAPIVPVELWKRVHDKLESRGRTNPDFGKRRTRSKVTHPLNGKLYCPDCDKPMVLGSSMPAAGQRGQKTRCFNCGTYRRFSRTKCHANTVGWDRLDEAVEILLETVKERIDRLANDPIKTMQTESWAKDCELTKAMEEVFSTVMDGPPEIVSELGKPADPSVPIIDYIVAAYNKQFVGQTETLRAEYDEAEQQLLRIGELLLEGVPSQTVKKQLNSRMTELEAKKKTIGARLTPLTLRIDELREQLGAIRRTIEQSEKASVAKILDQFVEKVIPRFTVMQVGPSKSRRAILESVEFIPKKTDAAKHVLPNAMEIGAAHTDMDSWPRRAGSLRERS